MKNISDGAAIKYITGISLKVARLRKRMGLNQIEFAKRAGIGLRFLRELERGKMSVRLDKVLQVLDFLGCYLEIRSDNEKIGKWLSAQGLASIADKLYDKTKEKTNNG
ncbi:MAG: helix-turn-helix transcriptional regulator [Candidatus Omnitrophica bacterium]|nr:helix-turn-helix transcriptional regulator [Candidatus Omnitrophota bacterium]